MEFKNESNVKEITRAYSGEENRKDDEKGDNCEYSNSKGVNNDTTADDKSEKISPLKLQSDENKTGDENDDKNDDYKKDENATVTLKLLSNDASLDLVLKSEKDITNATTRGPDKEVGDDEGEDDATYHPVDRGYAWVVMIAVFMCQFIMIGYLKSLGILFVEFQNRFGSNASMTSLVIGVMEGSASIGSFTVLTFVLKKVSPRTLCVCGSILATVSITGNCFVTKFEYLCITQGVGLGISLAIVIGTSCFVLTQYFKYRRPMATSIATCGASLGGVASPLLIRFLLDEYGFQGGILMTGGVIMHVIIFSSLFIPVENFRPKDRIKVGEMDIENPKFDIRADTRSTTNAKENGDKCINHSPLLNQLDKKCVEINFNNRDISLDSTQLSKNLEQLLYEKHKDVIIKKTTTVSQGSRQNCVSEDHLTSTTSKHISLTPSVPTPNRHHEGRMLADQQTALSPSDALSRNNKVSKLADADSAIVVEADMDVDLSSLRKRELSRLSASTASVFHSTSTLHTIFSDVMAREYVDHKESERKTGKSSKNFLETMCKGFTHNPLLKSASFWLLVVFFFCANIANGLPIVFIPALAKERGLSEDDGAFFLALNGILDFPARLLPGLIVNCGWLRPSTVCIGPILLIGVIGHLTPFFHSYESILAMVTVYGLFSGVYFSMNILVVIEVFGFKNYTTVIGSYFLVMGLGGAVAFPAAGLLKDVTGTYSSTFHFLATSSLLSACMLFLLPLAKRYDMRRGILEDLPIEG